MKMLTSVVAGIAVAAGSLGATVAFRTAADTPTSTTPPKAVAPVQPTRVPHVKRPTELRFKPCPKGTERAGDHCVRHVVHTVVVGGSTSAGTPAAGAAPQAPPPPPVPVQQPAGPSRARDGGGRPATHEGRGSDGDAEHEDDHADEPEQHEQEPSED